MIDLEFDASGLVPGVVQHVDTGQVLMLAYLNQQAVDATYESGYVHFWSRSRRQLWKKGEISGNLLAFTSMHADCDRDAVLILARPAGPTCHTGARTCFGEEATATGNRGFARLDELWATIADRALRRPEGSYTTQLLDAGVDATGRKVLEEAAEVVEAALQHARLDIPSERIAAEAADLIYHLLVLLAERDSQPAEVLDILSDRAR